MKTNHTKVVEKDATSKEKDFKEQKMCNVCQGFIESGEIPTHEIAPDNWCICKGFRRTQKEMERISQEVDWEQGPFESQDAEELNKEFGVTEYEIKNSN